MSELYNSAQEALLGPMFQNSMASYFVFMPDEWTKQKGTNREPSDFAWVCNNCVILIHMKSVKSHTNRQRVVRVRNEAIEKNLMQLRGWIKHWKRGQLLKGTNKFAKFSIPFSTDFFVIALSVIKSSDAECIAHPEVAKELGITYCATLTQSVIERIIGLGGSTLDLLNIMRSFSFMKIIEESRAIDLVNEYCHHSFVAAGADVFVAGWHRRRKILEFDEIGGIYKI